MKTLFTITIGTLFFGFIGISGSYSQISYSGDIQKLGLTPTNYDLDITIDYNRELINATVAITVKNTSDSMVDEIPLILYRLMNVLNVNDERGNPVDFNQQVLSYEDFGKKQVNFIQVKLPMPITPGKEKSIFISYEGLLLGYSEIGWRYVKDHISPEFTILRNDALAFPMVGVPSQAINRKSPFPSFHYRARITVPDSLIVANGGTLVNTNFKNETATYTYASIKPSWRLDFAISRYKKIESEAYRIFYFPEDSTGANGVKHAAENAVNLFTEWFGTLNEQTKLTFLEIPSGWGSQADVTTIIQTAAAFQDPSRHREVYHEISHLWNVTATDRFNPRWNEGLASFLEYLLMKELDNRDHLDYVANWRIDYIKKKIADNPESGNIPLIDYGKEGLEGYSYTVGALMFDLIYHLAGPDEFKKIVGGYYQTFAESGATTEDLVHFAKQTCSKDLNLLFNDWVYTTNWYTRVRQVNNIDELRRFYKEKLNSK